MRRLRRRLRRRVLASRLRALDAADIDLILDTAIAMQMPAGAPKTPVFTSGGRCWEIWDTLER